MRRRDLLKACGVTAGATLLGGLVPSARARIWPRSDLRPRRVLIVFAVGGWDTAYALDPKTPEHVDVPAGAVQQFEGLDIFTDPSRPAVTDFFTRYAANTALIRGIAIDAINHNECQRRIATGTREETRPDLGAIIAHDRGNDLPLPYLILGDVAFAGPFAASAGRVGATNQIVDLLGYGSTEHGPGQGVAAGAHDAPTVAEDDLIYQYQHASAERARATRGAIGYNRKRLDDFASSIDRAGRLRGLADRFGTRGETRAFTAQIQLALDALERDLSYAVMLTTQSDWDTHGDNFRQAEFHDGMFAGLATLVGELIARPGRDAGSRMIDDTVVVCISELGRSPRLGGSDPAHLGKDHWPVTSALVIGGGVAGGRVYGATTPDAQAVTIDLATGAPDPAGAKLLYTYFTAGVLALCGVEPSLHLGATQVMDAFIA